MVRTRCKLMVTEVAKTTVEGREIIRCQAQYDPELPEDVRFMSATPTGKMEFVLDNPVLIGKFKPGQQFYVDMTEIVPEN